MQKLRKFLAVLVCAAMALSLVPCVGFAEEISGTCGENLTWTLVDGVLTISGTGDMTDYWNYLADYAPWYSSRESITSVIIEDGVTSIGDCAFWGCESLTNITIPDSVMSIGNYAFYLCASLENVTLSANVTNIGNYAFCACYSLTDITIPDRVTSISAYAFAHCTGLANVAIGNGVTSIYPMAFEYCENLASVTMSNSVTSIDYGAFHHCTSLTDVYYGGTEAQWDEIEINEVNDYLTNATIHYNYVPAEPEIKTVSAIVEEGEIDITAEIANASDAKALAIGYGTDGEYVSVSEISDGTATLPADGVKTVKVFVWESLETLRPLCAAKEVAVE